MDGISIRDYHVIVDAAPAAVFDFVVDVRNLPKWAIHFCKGIRLVADGAIVTTDSGGELYFGVTGDRDLGVLDWWAGPTKPAAERWPTRVVSLPDGRALYHVTAIFGAVVPPDVDGMFADELGTLKRLVEAGAAVAA